MNGWGRLVMAIWMATGCYTGRGAAVINPTAASLTCFETCKRSNGDDDTRVRCVMSCPDAFELEYGCGRDARHCIESEQLDVPLSVLAAASPLIGAGLLVGAYYSFVYLMGGR